MTTKDEGNADDTIGKVIWIGGVRPIAWLEAIIRQKRTILTDIAAAEAEVARLTHELVIHDHTMAVRGSKSELRLHRMTWWWWFGLLPTAALILTLEVGHRWFSALRKGTDPAITTQWIMLSLISTLITLLFAWLYYSITTRRLKKQLVEARAAKERFQVVSRSP